MGEVWKVWDQSSREYYAVKLSKNIEYNSFVLTEKNILQKMKYPFIPQIIGEVQNGYIMNLIQGETLHDKLLKQSQITILSIVSYMIQLLGILNYLHNLQCIHLDVKLSNLIVNTKNQLYLIDFGTSCINKSKIVRRYITNGYVNFKFEHLYDISYSSDLYACAKVIIALIHKVIEANELNNLHSFHCNLPYFFQDILYRCENNMILKEDTQTIYEEACICYFYQYSNWGELMVFLKFCILCVMLGWIYI